MSKMDSVIETLRGFATSKSPVFIGGETGTGKSRIAPMIHTLSGRRGPYVEVDCASQTGTLLASALFGHARGAFTGALTDHKGFFVQAHGGTIFLDEIGEMPLDQQPALLRVVQDGRLRPLGARADTLVDVRVVAASNRDLAAEVKAGRFRRDLYGRLVRLPVTIPPLRERADEIPAMAVEIAGRLGLPPPSPEIVAALTSPCPWPHNIRDLESIIERAHLLKWSAGEVLAEMGGLGERDTQKDAALRPGREDRLATAYALSATHLGGWWTAAELAEATRVNKATICRDIIEWLEAGSIERQGKGRGARYRRASSHATMRDDARRNDFVGGEQ